VGGAYDAITEEHVGSARDAYRLFREGDPAVFDGMHMDVEWVVPDTLPGGGALRGQLAVLEFWDGIGKLWEDSYPDPEEFLPAGDALIVRGTWRARARSTGLRGDSPFVHVMRFRDGKLASIHQYLDTAKILQSLNDPAAG
jgi:ketosteroid isomerase-like protein